MLRSILVALMAASAAAFNAPASHAMRSLSSSRSAVSMGVQVQTTKPGNGVQPKAGQMVKAHYTGRLQDGTVFDSSRGFLRQPFQFQIGAGGEAPPDSPADRTQHSQRSLASCLQR